MQAHIRSDHVLRAKNRMASDFGSLVSDAEELLKSTANYSGESVNAARAKFLDTVNQFKGRLSGAQEATLNKWNQVAARTDGYVHDHPWKVVGVAAVIGLLVGALLYRK